MHAEIPITHRVYAIGTVIALLIAEDHNDRCMLLTSNEHMESISTDRRSKIDPNLKTLKFPNFESASHPARGVDARNATNGRSASLLYHPIKCWMPFLRKL